MSIYKINNNLSNNTKFDLLNSMILENAGKIEQGKFDKNEIDQIFDSLCLSRKYNRNTSVGHTISTYTNWTHFKEEDGYSIWKYTISDYSYSSVNNLYLDNKKLENRGQASTEADNSFDKVFLYNGGSGSGYVDNTTEAATEGGTEFEVMDSTNDYLYLGSSSKFNGVSFEWQTRGSNYTLKVEYYNGDWTELTANTNNLDDDTNNFESNGKISWDEPDDWTTTTINSENKYWIRISTTTTPVTTAKAYYIIPYNSVSSLLALSSTQILNEEWAWCSYNSNIYVTIRNDGNTAYEGNYYITASSSTTNKKNFFVYNHEYKIDYLSSDYDPIVIKTSNYTITGDEGIIFANGTLTLTLPSASNREGKRIIIKNIGTGTITIEAESGQTIDNNSSITLNTQYDFRILVSDGTNWYIIGE